MKDKRGKRGRRERMDKDGCDKDRKGMEKYNSVKEVGNGI